MGGRQHEPQLCLTRKTLENTHGFEFDVKPFPEMEEIVRLRTDRQARQIRTAMGSMAFEAYLPTVRELKTRPDGDVLLEVNQDDLREMGVSEIGPARVVPGSEKRQALGPPLRGFFPTR